MVKGPPRPLRIVNTTDSAEDSSFTLEDENLKHVLDQVPPDMKVAVVSVVGAFRTGKSFLLTFFLRFLHSESKQKSKGEEWMKYGGEKLWEGNANIRDPTDKGENAALSFEWRGGQERMTTGIMIWSEPFFRRGINGEEMAVLLVDTQGMFDNETSMGLTASIFGLSSLISSYQIYNVEKHIQEDHLQQLALFSEYGRMALDYREKGGPEKEVEVEKPFQLLEFLVRDWQNFDDDTDLKTMQHNMDEYLKEVIKSRNVKDLQETREQIIACFEKISCFGFCHPGLEVVKKKYDGSVNKIDPTFRSLLNAYTRRVFGNDLEPKRIHGRKLTAHDLYTYINTYVKLFDGGAHFPEATTLLEATSSANNSNAKYAALSRYKTGMEELAGPQSGSGYIDKGDLEFHHKNCIKSALEIFDGVATMGRKAAIVATREDLIKELSSELERYEQLNEARRPFKDLEYYVIPMGIAATAFILRSMADASCSSWSDTCRKTSHGLSWIYVSIFAFILFSSYSTLKTLAIQISKMLPMLSGGSQSSNRNLNGSIGMHSK